MTRRPIPASSRPSGTGAGEGWIVLRVCGIVEVEDETGPGCGYVGAE